MNDEGRRRLNWLENGEIRWNVWNAQDELRLIEERCRWVVDGDSWDIRMVGYELQDLRD